MMVSSARNFTSTEIQLSSGEAFDYAMPESHNMSLEDITNSLALICRYNGHSKKHYSVAQHSCMVGDMMKIDGAKPEEILYGYTHDFGESVYCDLPQPLKAFFRGSGLLQMYSDYEDRFIQRVYENIGAKPATKEIKKLVKRYDILSLEFEMANILSNNVHGHTLVDIRSKKLDDENFDIVYPEYKSTLTKIFQCDEKDFAYSQDIDWGKMLKEKVLEICHEKS